MVWSTINVNMDTLLVFCWLIVFDSNSAFPHKSKVYIAILHLSLATMLQLPISYPWTTPPPSPLLPPMTGIKAPTLSKMAIYSIQHHKSSYNLWASQPSTISLVRTSLTHSSSVVLCNHIPPCRSLANYNHWQVICHIRFHVKQAEEGDLDHCTPYP
jgi:hypothetical protein